MRLACLGCKLLSSDSLQCCQSQEILKQANETGPRSSWLGELEGQVGSPANHTAMGQAAG